MAGLGDQEGTASGSGPAAGCSGRLKAAAFSPDARLVLTASTDQTAKIWDASSGRLVRTLQGHLAEIYSVAFSPDGQRIATGSDDRTAKVWDATSGRELLTYKGHKVALTSVAFSPDGQRIISSANEKTARIWDANTGKELMTLTGHGDGICSAVFSKNDQRVVTGSLDRTAKVWDAATGQELLTLKGHSEPIQAVAFSPDGDRIVTGSADRTARVWLTARPEQIVAWQMEEREARQYLATLREERSADEQRKRLARAVDEGVIKCWRILAPIPLAPGQSGAEGLAIEQIPGESQLQPRAGEAVPCQNRQLRWQDVVLPDEVLEFKSILGRVTPHSVAYAVCCVWAEAELSKVRMLVGSSDRATVFLNGRQVHQWLNGRAYSRERDMVPDLTSLRAGTWWCSNWSTTRLTGWLLFDSAMPKVALCAGLR